MTSIHNRQPRDGQPRHGKLMKAGDVHRRGVALPVIPRLQQAEQGLGGNPDLKIHEKGGHRKTNGDGHAGEDQRILAIPGAGVEALDPKADHDVHHLKGRLLVFCVWVLGFFVDFWCLVCFGCFVEGLFCCSLSSL